MLVLFRSYLKSDYGLQEEKIIRKRADLMKRRKARAKAQDRKIHPLHCKMPPVVQMSLQFIRTLRNHFSTDIPITACLAKFKASLSAYL